MSEEKYEGTVLEMTTGNMTIRVVARKGETSTDLYNRLCLVSAEIEMIKRVKEGVAEIGRNFNISQASLADTGINGDYHRVMVSLLRNFDSCMGASEIAQEWGGINTGNVSRVFKASKDSTKAYEGHFEKCQAKGYRFTRSGLEYALSKGIEELKTYLAE